MTRLHKWESRFKWLTVGCLFATLMLYAMKDRLPPPGFYDSYYLSEPVQTETTAQAFTVKLNDQQYLIEPQFDYELHGVVVSYHDAGNLRDIWHHDKWKDFINLRDLCVVWGENVSSGVYQDMDFHNDSWTCWAYWPDRATGQRFKTDELSNNHLLVDDTRIKQTLLKAEVGDHIRLKGQLASYRNPGNNFSRGTSTTRSDTGNGACETIYVSEFQIVKKANATLRGLYEFAKWSTVLALTGFVLLFFKAPPVKR